MHGPTHRNGHTLDLVLSRVDDDLLSSISSRDHGFPDHWPVFVTLNLQKPPLPVKTFKYRKVKTVSEVALKDLLRASPLCDGMHYETSALEDIVMLYNNVLKEFLDQLAPLKQRTVVVRPPSKWYNQAIRSAKQQRRQKERLWRKTGLTVHRDLFMEERKQVNDMILEAKRTFYREAIMSCGQDTKRLFHLTSEIMGKTITSTVPMDLSPNLANMFSDFFVQKIEQIHASIPPCDVPSLSEMHLSGEVIPMSSFRALSIEETSRLISRTGTKTCGLDPMPTELVKRASEELTPIIQYIVNTSLQNGSFPQTFKKAIVTPRLKKSTADPASCSSYRPVSNLPFLSKVLERGAADQLTDHLESQNLCEPMQSAYRPLHSTETALVKIHDDICRAIGERKVVLLVLLDLSAAFDTVNHDLLLQILAKYKVGGTVLQWFKSYLSDREQVVLMQNVSSDPSILQCGVPQGSVLGPLLFSVYTSTLGNLLRHSNVDYHLYADDTQVYIAVSPEELNEGVAKMEDCIRLVRSWMSHHHLKMNESKTEFLVLSNKHIAQQIRCPELDVCGHMTAASATAKNIGVFIDTNMTMEAHITNICNRAYRLLHCIAKAKQFLDRQSLECIIHAFITTRLDYCNAILCGASQGLKQKLQRVQNAAARILMNAKRWEHITPILRELHWLPVECRIEFKVLVLVYKCANNLAPSYLCQLIRPYSPGRNLRAADQTYLSVPFTTSDFIKNNAFSYVAPSLFNVLPLSVRVSPSLDVFKTRLKTYLFTRYFN